MRIQYASDLHLEFVTNRNYLRMFPMKVTGDILVLAGDIQYLKVGYVADPFWEWASANYRQVIVTKFFRKKNYLIMIILVRCSF